MKQIRKLQSKVTPTAAKWRWVCFLMLCALTGLVGALCARLVDSQSLRITLAALGRADLWFTALFLALAASFVSLVTHSLFLSGLAVLPISVFLSFVNLHKLAITSTPLQITEFALAGRLGEIATLNVQSISLSRNSALAFGTVLLWLLVLLFFSKPLRPRWSRSLLAALAPLALFLLIFRFGADSLVYTPLGVGFEQTMNQSASNEHCGVLLGLWRTYVRQEKSPLMEYYSRSYMDYLVDEAEGELPALLAPAGREKANIILILSESFFDVTTLPNVEYEGDPLAAYHALQEEGVSGAFHSRTVGYGTCNIELEILTGVNTSLLNREDLYNMDTNLLTRLPTVPSLLEETGYETTMFHLFDDSIYHRGTIFGTLGFDHTYFPKDFGQIDPAAGAASDYWGYLNEQVDGSFYSDDYMTDLFIHLYEQKGEAPQFLYGISMENHTPHNGTKYAGEGYTVSFTSPLGEADAGILLDASQGAANASDALGRLCDYFREQEEPTVIFFYGDHRPTMASADGIQTVYSNLGLSTGLDQSKWTEEEMEELHSTSYLIWSNDPSYLPAQPGTVTDTSSNYFGLSLLDAADISLPLYWRMLEQAHETRMIDTLEYHLGRDGSMSRSDELLTQTEQERLSRLALCLHDAIYGKRYVTDRLSE